jgi:hypothetical protein
MAAIQAPGRFISRERPSPPSQPMTEDTVILYASGVSLIFIALLLAYLIHRNTPS